jgi:hypothetical protein
VLYDLCVTQHVFFMHLLLSAVWMFLSRHRSGRMSATP